MTGVDAAQQLGDSPVAPAASGRCSSAREVAPSPAGSANETPQEEPKRSGSGIIQPPNCRGSDSACFGFHLHLQQLQHAQGEGLVAEGAAAHHLDEDRQGARQLSHGKHHLVGRDGRRLDRVTDGKEGRGGAAMGPRCGLHLQQVRLSLRVEERRQDVGVQREQRGGREAVRPQLESFGGCGGNS